MCFNKIISLVINLFKVFLYLIIKLICSVFIFFICNVIFSLFVENVEQTYLIYIPCLVSAYLIYILWIKFNDAYRSLNDTILFLYATYLAFDKIIHPNTPFINIPINVSLKTMFSSITDMQSHINLIVLFLIAICSMAKAMITYKTFSSDYKKKKTGLQKLS